MLLTDLVDLQRIDKQIMKIEVSMGDLPRTVESLKSKLELTNKEMDDSNTELTECRLSRAKAEGDLQALGGQLEKYQEQVYSVTTNKEYDAISTEIESAEVAIETSETEILEFFDREEKLVAGIKILEEKVAEIEKELEDKIVILNEKLKENETETLRLQHERELCVRKVSRPILATYERIRRRHGGIALAETQKYSCGECFAHIPVQIVVEVRKMDHIIYCESCGRILVSVNNKQ